jgi:nucleoside-diphosphate-sugar epimerase
MLMDLSGIRKKVVYDTTKPDGCRRKSADMTKLRKVTKGFEPRTSLSEGLIETIQAHRARA